MTTNAGLDAGNKNIYLLLVWIQAGASSVEISVEVSQEDGKTDLPCDAALPLLGFHPRTGCSPAQMTCPSVHSH